MGHFGRSVPEGCVEAIQTGDPLKMRDTALAFELTQLWEKIRQPAPVAPWSLRSAVLVSHLANSPFFLRGLRLGQLAFSKCAHLLGNERDHIRPLGWVFLHVTH